MATTPQPPLLSPEELRALTPWLDRHGINPHRTVEDLIDIEPTPGGNMVRATWTEIDGDMALHKQHHHTLLSFERTTDGQFRSTWETTTEHTPPFWVIDGRRHWIATHTWVLTPEQRHDPTVSSALHRLASEMGTITPDTPVEFHDAGRGGDVQVRWTGQALLDRDQYNALSAILFARPEDKK